MEFPDHFNNVPPKKTIVAKRTVMREWLIMEKEDQDVFLCLFRMRLEERRKQIESEKKRMEMQWNRQKQKIGKQAFIQVGAVS